MNDAVAITAIAVGFVTVIGGLAHAVRVGIRITITQVGLIASVNELAKVVAEHLAEHEQQRGPFATKRSVKELEERVTAVTTRLEGLQRDVGTIWARRFTDVPIQSIPDSDMHIGEQA